MYPGPARTMRRSQTTGKRQSAFRTGPVARDLSYLGLDIKSKAARLVLGLWGRYPNLPELEFIIVKCCSLGTRGSNWSFYPLLSRSAEKGVEYFKRIGQKTMPFSWSNSSCMSPIRT